MFSPMRAVSLPAALPSSNARHPVAAVFGGAALFMARTSRHTSGSLAERGEEEVEMSIRVRRRDRDAQAGGTGWHGGRTDGLHQQAALAELGSRGQRGLGSAEHDGEDGSRRLRGQPESA